MKNFISLIMILLISIFVSNAEEYHVYQQLLEKTFNFGSQEEDFGVYITPAGNESASAFCFDSEGYLYINDCGNKRILVFGYNYNYIREIAVMPFFYARSLEIDEDENFIGISIIDSVIQKISNNNEKIISVNLSEVKNDLRINIATTMVIEDQIFFNDRDGNLLSINKSEYWEQENNDPIKIRNIQSTEETRNIVINNPDFQQNNISIDENNRLFSDGELLTRDYNTFYDYWQEQHQMDEELKRPVIDVTLTAEYFYDTSSMVYLGKDRDGNYYWLSSKAVVVFDNNGFLLDVFIPQNHKYMMTKPAIHPSGDVYFLGYDSEHVYLYKIPRIWYTQY